MNKDDILMPEAQSQTPAESIYYYHNDHLGTPKLLTDETGAVVWDVDYTPFGEISSYVTNTLPTDQPFRFPGQYQDSITGLYYNWNRYYMPEVGRYNSLNIADYFYHYNGLIAYFEATCDDSAIIKFNNTLPLSSDIFSNYKYVANNPILSIDNNGLDEEKKKPTIVYRCVSEGFCIGQRICCCIAVTGTLLPSPYGGGGGITIYCEREEEPIEGCRKCDKPKHCTPKKAEF